MTRKPDTALARAIVLACAAALSAACTSIDHQREAYPDPKDRLNHVLTEYDQAKMDNSECFELWDIDHANTDCQRIQREVERLFAEFPADQRILMANAVLNIETGRPDKAQYYLDQLLGQRGAHPEAAVLRSELALMEGNATLALELLEAQILLAPDHAGLREAQAAAFYLRGEYNKSRIALAIAGRLGSPGWRLSYHHGLLCEAERDWAAACRQYSLALEQKPDYTPAQSRLIGLGEHEACRDVVLTPFSGTGQ